MKIERYSYPVITPSATRAIFDAILWKPGVRWQPRRVELLTPPRFIGLRRNEVKDKGPGEQKILRWRDGRAPIEPIIADGDSELLETDQKGRTQKRRTQKGRTQRQTMALKNVRYRLYAQLVGLPGGREDLRGMDQQFGRRAQRGQCVWQPCLGCREFPAYFTWLEPGTTGPGTAGPQPVPVTQDLGWMVYDVFDLSRINGPSEPASVSLFRAVIRDGVLDIPPYESPDVTKPPPLSSSPSSSKPSRSQASRHASRTA
jgi:CRISPR-associated protein Cas5d